MKSLRNIALSILMTAGIFAAVTYTACNKDACKDVVCQQGGYCVDGNCVCPVGFSGKLCETENSDKRVKYVKTWTAHYVNVADATKTGDYSCIISLNTTISTQVIIDQSFFKNFFVHTINASVSGSTITIPLQSPDGVANYSVQGSGSYSNGQILWTYTVTEPVTMVAKSYTDTWK